MKVPNSRRGVMCAWAVAALAMGQASDYQRGVALVEKGEYAAALPFLGRAAKAQPGDAPTWKALGVAFAAQKQYEPADAAFARACELDARLQDACYYHGRALYALDRFDASLRVLQRAADRNPKSWKVRLGIAEALEALGRSTAAETAFAETIALVDLEDPQPAVAYARFLIRQGRAPEAVPVLEKVLKRFPESGEARTQIGRALLEQDDVDPAIAHLKQAVALAPGSAQAHVLLGKAYTRAGRPAEAKAEYEAASRCEQSSRR